MDTVKQNEVLLKAGKGWLYFSQPHEILVASTLEDVPGVLNEIERRVERHGWHAAGFISYEAAPAFDPALLSRLLGDFPYLWFGLYSQPDPVALPRPLHPRRSLDWKPTVDRASYNAAIDQVRDYIARGRTYQVNYTMRLQADFDADPWDFFLHFAQNQNQHGAYVDTGRYVLCSASPELFFELDGERITSRPMKGTTPRGRTTAEDQYQADWLKASEKNRAENVMIVDMIRNDLGRIARTGSVHVPALFSVERYPTLWQMTSTVTAQTGASLAGIFNALFPCASITGAPKISTMQIIHKLETTPRKIYTGTIGHISPGRKASFNVAIRTVLVDRESQKAEYGIGGGVIWDSTSADEYAEAMLKARVLRESSPAFSLLETLLWTPDGGYFLQNRHMERLIDSAAYFDFAVSREAAEQNLQRTASGLEKPQRVRLLLDRTGNLETTCSPLSRENKPIRACRADRPIDSNNLFLFHKTTYREVYDMARKDHPECDDVLLYNQRGELTEFTIGNLVVELDGELITPPIDCGLLPGTFRAHLVDCGEVTERIVPLQRLKECMRIYRVNSVRKWEPVIIQ